MCCSRSQGDAQFYCPVNEVGIIDGSASVMYNRLRDSEGMYPFLNSRYDSMRSSLRNWAYHQETRDPINNQETVKVPNTWWVKGSFVINMDCSERDCLILPFLQWYLVSVFRLWFFVLAGGVISSECTYPVEHARPVVESFCNIIRFWNAHMFTHFVVRPSLKQARKSAEGKQNRRFLSSSLSDGSL